MHLIFSEVFFLIQLFYTDCRVDKGDIKLKIESPQDGPNYFSEFCELQVSWKSVVEFPSGKLNQDEFHAPQWRTRRLL
jgi:hypothetical protein